MGGGLLERQLPRGSHQWKGLGDRAMPPAGAARWRIRQPGAVSALAIALQIRRRRAVFGEWFPGGARAAMMLGRHERSVWYRRMRREAALTLTAAAALLIGGSVAVSLNGRSAVAEPAAPYVPQVLVVRAVNACFAATIRVTGFLVAREEAVVTLDAPGLKVTEVLVGEGAKVKIGDVLVRLVRQAGEGPEPPSGAQALALQAPATGLVTRSTAAVGAMASPMPGEPLFRIAV